MANKSWCYTLNNYTDEDVEQFKAFECKRHRCCKEVGESGTPHLQGFITFGKSMRLGALKKLNDRTHWEPCKVKEASLNYCTKGEIIIDSNSSEQGKRSDLEEAIETLKKTGLKGVREEHATVYVKHHKGLKALIYDFEGEDIPKWQPIEVSVFWGDSQVGKTRKCYEIDPDLYCVPVPMGNGCLWWDGYRGQETILFDDFYGWVPYHEMLHLLHGYRKQLQIKGGHTYKAWKRVLITSNKHPRDWYWKIEDTTALMKRISDITHMVESETETEVPR